MSIPEDPSNYIGKKRGEDVTREGKKTWKKKTDRMQKGETNEKSG